MEKPVRKSGAVTPRKAGGYLRHPVSAMFARKADRVVRIPFASLLAPAAPAAPASAQDTGVRRVDNLQGLERATAGRANVSPTVIGSGTADHPRSSVIATGSGTPTGGHSGVAGTGGSGSATVSTQQCTTAREPGAGPLRPERHRLKEIGA
jgi:hypothetical protein